MNEQPRKSSMKNLTDRQRLLFWCRKKANNENLADADDFAFVLDRLEDIMENIGIASESLADMSQTFDGSTHKQMMGLLSPYRRVKFL